MKSLLLLLMLALTASACSTEGKDDKSNLAEERLRKIEVSVSPTGEKVEQSYIIPCAKEEQLCELLASEEFFSLPSKEQVCTELYGGPQKLTLTKELWDGRQVSKIFSRTNGCEIARYDALVEYLERAEAIAFKAPVWRPEA